MTKSLVVLTVEEAKKLCERLEFDASWDKTDGAYYTLQRQLKDFGHEMSEPFLSADLRQIVSLLEEEIEDWKHSGELATLRQLDDIVDGHIGNVVSKLKSVQDTASFIARNPEVLEFSESRKPVSFRENSNLLEIVRTEAVVDYLNKHAIQFIYDAFVSQFPDDYIPIEGYRAAVGCYLDELEASNVALPEGWNFTSLRSKLADANEPITVPYLGKMAEPIKAKHYNDILIAENALSLVKRFASKNQAATPGL